MQTEHLSPEQSLRLITKVVQQARNRFEENGFIYIFWGTLVATASFAQYFLLTNGYESINWIPYLLMPLGGIFTFIYYNRKRKPKSNNQISRIISVTWIALSTNIMILGFLFSLLLQSFLVPVILLLLAIGLVISGVALKSNLLLFPGILVNILAFACFHIDWLYHSLAMGFAAIVAILIPGILLMLKNKRSINV